MIHFQAGERGKKLRRTNRSKTTPIIFAVLGALLCTCTSNEDFPPENSTFFESITCTDSISWKGADEIEDISAFSGAEFYGVSSDSTGRFITISYYRGKRRADSELGFASIHLAEFKTPIGLDSALPEIPLSRILSAEELENDGDVKLVQYRKVNGESFSLGAYQSAFRIANDLLSVRGWLTPELALSPLGPDGSPCLTVIRIEDSPISQRMMFYGPTLEREGFRDQGWAEKHVIRDAEGRTTSSRFLDLEGRLHAPPEIGYAESFHVFAGDRLIREGWLGADSSATTGPDGFSTSVEYGYLADDLSSAFLEEKRTLAKLYEKVEIEHTDAELEQKAWKQVHDSNLIGSKHYDKNGELIGIALNESGYTPMHWGKFAFDPLHAIHNAAANLYGLDEYAYWLSCVPGMQARSGTIAELDEDYNAANAFDRRKRDHAFSERIQAFSGQYRVIERTEALVIDSYDFDRKRFKLSLLSHYGEYLRGSAPPRTIGWEAGSGKDRISVEFQIQGPGLPQYWELPESQAEEVLAGAQNAIPQSSILLSVIGPVKGSHSNQSGSRFRITCEVMGIVIHKYSTNSNRGGDVLGIIPRDRDPIELPMLPDYIYERELSDAQKKQLFWDLVDCEDANPASPRLTELCIDQACMKLKITRTQALAVIKEGHDSNWPMPE